MPKIVRWLLLWWCIGQVGGYIPTFANTPEPEYLTLRNGLPQGYVSAIVQDRRGFIWMATRDGLCRYDGIRFRVFTHKPNVPASLSFSSIYEIKEDKQGKLWLRTENNLIDCFDPVTEQSHQLSGSVAYKRALRRNQLVAIQPDGQGNVWVATESNGFFRLNANGTISHQHWANQTDSTEQIIHGMLFDSRARLWLATSSGLFRYQPQSNSFTSFTEAQQLPQHEVFRLQERKNGELLLGFPGQFAVFNPNRGQVRRVVALPNQPGLPVFTRSLQGIDFVNQNRFTDSTGLVPLWPDPAHESTKLARFSVISALVDRTNVLWLGLNGDGVVKYDLNKPPFQTWPYTYNFQTTWLTEQWQVPSASIPDAIRQVPSAELRYQFDRRRQLWISSLEYPPYRYDPVQQVFTAVSPAGIEPHLLPNGTFRLSTLATGAEGELWGLLGPTNRTIVRYNPDQQNFTAFPLPIPANHSYTITAMLVDGGRIYLATEQHGLLRADLSPKRLIHWQSVSGQTPSQPGSSLLCLAKDPSQYKYLWIGTFGDGLCRLDKLTGRIERFSLGAGHSNNIIYAIYPASDGYLWLSTNRGLCRFDTRTFAVRTFMTDDGLPGEEFKPFHDVALPDGRLIFGGITGYTAFRPNQITEDPYTPTVALTGLRINNQPVDTTTPDSPLIRALNETAEIRLDYQQNFLSIDFAALEFNQPHKNKYRYKLAGLDNDWIYSENLSTATYTNLSPGTYTFMVNASNTSGIWSAHMHTLRLVIEPPLWATWWAYTTYCLLLLGGTVLFIRYRIRRLQQQSQLKLREQESEQLKQLDAVKTRFFANITHELRTPLTLILTPLEQVLNDTINSPYHSRLSLIYRNADRLLRLINELLDLAKLEAGNLTINPTPADLPEFLYRLVAGFRDEADRKHILLLFEDTFTQPFYWFDPDKVEKIIANLLSNALKFTDEGGTVSVRVKTTPQDAAQAHSAPTDLILLSVHNSGTGIPTDQLTRIFDRFYQANPTAEQTTSGSGIGLALVKELVERMGGSISVESPANEGTTFLVSLPCRQARPELVQADPGSLPINPTATKGDLGCPVADAADDTAHWILLVEDNHDLAELITSMLTPEWRVKRVANGLVGVNTALAEGPDLIVSDILMPEMNGFELCRTLKANPISSHIPILLLTAKSSPENRLEGLMAGADDYLAKPFQVDELRARIRNRLWQQARTRQHYRTQLLREGNLPTFSQHPQDEFMNKVYQILEGRLDDSTFGVEPLADAIGMSRMHLNRKVKAMTGMTPIELIRIVRLKRAVELLLSGSSVSEAADRVGFDTPAYFSKVFKEQYHMTPSEFIDQNRHETV